ALDAVAALFDLVARAVRVVAADVQLVLFVQQVGVHRRRADRATVLATQYAGLGFALVVRRDLFARHQVDRGLATLLRRQAVARAAQEHTRGSGTDQHRPAALLAGDVGKGRLVGQHAILGGLGGQQLLAEITVE